MNAATKTLWENFGQYVVAPYGGAGKSSLELWFGDLYGRVKSGEDIRLDFVTARNRMTGKSFNGFRLNEAMFVSHNAAVLTVPFPRMFPHFAMGRVAPDLHIGLWLHDFGDHDALLRRSAEALRGLKAGRVNPDTLNADERVHFRLARVHFDEIDFVARQIKDELKSSKEWVSVDAALGDGEVRYARSKPLADEWHTDVTTKESNTNARIGDFYNHVIAYPFLNRGTEYALPAAAKPHESKIIKPSNIVSCPLFAVSSHLTLQINRREDLVTAAGALHRARGHEDGRGIFIFPEFGEGREWRPIENVAPNWVFKPAAYNP